jgi:hypothetical protein
MEEYTIFSYKAFFIYKHLIKEWLLLLYGFEIWGLENNEIMERIQLEFWKLQLELKYSTPVMSSKIWLLSKCDKERILKKTCRMVAKKKMIKRWVTTPYHIFIYLCLFSFSFHEDYIRYWKEVRRFVWVDFQTRKKSGRLESEKMVFNWEMNSYSGFLLSAMKVKTHKIRTSSDWKRVLKDKRRGLQMSDLSSIFRIVRVAIIVAKAKRGILYK